MFPLMLFPFALQSYYTEPSIQQKVLGLLVGSGYTFK